MASDRDREPPAGSPAEQRVGSPANQPARPSAEPGGSASAFARPKIRAELGAEEAATVAALRRSNALLFVVAAVSASAFAITDLINGRYAEVGGGYLALVATAVLAWAGYALRDRGQQTAWALGVGVAAVASVVLLVSDRSVSMTLAGVLVVLMWGGLLLPPIWSAALGAIALGVLLAVVDGLTAATGGTTYTVLALATLVLVPLGLSATLDLRRRTLETSINASFGKLERQRAELERALETKVDELELSREQLFDAQKLKTVGTMASGLAHELNNILTPIRGHAELIAEGAATLEQSRRYGQRILDSAAAAAQITGGLLTYTRQTTFQPVRSNLRQLLQSQILPVLSKSLPGNVRLKVDLERTVSVDVDRVLLQQTIANLIFNAVDAMPEGGEIVIALKTSHRPVQDDEVSEDGTDAPRSALLTISDTGTGIEREHLDQIFDPFFTTKAVGSGSGLGLAMVVGTITRHHGRVLVDSEPGKGTTFTIMLPLAKAADDGAAAHKPWPVLRGESKGPVVVVLTEDQDALDEFEELLEATECSPICTNEARGAKNLLTEMGDKVDLLILDLELETSDAGRLFKSVRELFPDMPVILLADQPTQPAVQAMLQSGPTRSVRKPMDNRLFSALLTDLLQPSEGYVRDFTPVPVTTGAAASGPHPRVS